MRRLVMEKKVNITKNISIELLPENNFKSISFNFIKVLISLAYLMFLFVPFSKDFFNDPQGLPVGHIIGAFVIFLCVVNFLFIHIEWNDKVNLITTIVVTVLLLVSELWLMQYSQGYELIMFKFKFFALNMLVIFTMFAILFAITNSVKVSIIVIKAISIVLALTNYFLSIFRGTGFIGADIFSFSAAKEVAGGYTYTINTNIYFYIVIQIALCIMVTVLGKNEYVKGKKRLISAGVALLLVAIFYYAFFMCDALVKPLKVKYFKPQETYASKGTYANMTRSFRDLIVEKPKGYSVKKVKEIVSKTPQTEARIKDEDKPNVIMIMDEAFSDFSDIMDLKISEDAMPYIHSMKKNTVKGKMFTSIFGGGTVATEFEALTSNTMACIPNGIVAYTTYIHKPMYSMANFLEQQGYDGMVAMHPYKPTGYNRHKVYPLFGFRQFISLAAFSRSKKLRTFVSDEGNFDKIISEYEYYEKNNDKPFFMFDVTMQNHSPYDRDFPDLKMPITTWDDAKFPMSKRYFNLIKNSDNAVKKLTQYFAKKKEKTIIIFFGDHQPKLEDELYDLSKQTTKLDEEYAHLYKYTTPFFMWANYDIEEKENVNISANYIMPTLFDEVGLAKTSYLNFISSVQKEIPVLTKHGYIGADGKYYKADDKKSPYKKKWDEYNIVQYNNLFDVDHRVKEIYELKK